MTANENTTSNLLPFLAAVSKIDPIKISVVHLLETIEKDVHDLHINEEETDNSTNKADLGIFWALTLSSCMGSKSVKMTDRWENVLWTIIELVSHWRPENNQDLGYLVNDLLKPWVLKMFTDQKLCPNPYLRLEMLRFICMYPDTFLLDAYSGMQVVEGLIVNSLYMELQHLEQDNLQMNLAYPLIKVLEKLNEYGHTRALAAAAVQQVTCLKIGPEASFFNHIVQLLGQHAEASRVNYLSNLDVVETISSFSDIISLFEQLVVTQYTMTAYEVPGLAEAAAASLVAITSSLVATTQTLRHEACRKKKKSLLSLFTQLDDVYELLSITENSSIFQVLCLDHAQLLSSLNKQVVKWGLCFDYFPEPNEESSEDCPEKFIDSLTQAVMKAPVLLHSSKMVVDESTLIHLLLVSPTDPFTRCPLDNGSYSRLPELQAEIFTWRNSSLENIVIYRDVNSDENNIEIESRSAGNADNSTDYMNSIDVKSCDCELHKLLLHFDL